MPTRYDYTDDSDAGDISLSFPSSRSDPNLSSFLFSQPLHASRGGERDITSPTPRRDYGRSPLARQNGTPTVSLNDDEVFESREFTSAAAGPSTSTGSWLSSDRARTPRERISPSGSNDTTPTKRSPHPSSSSATRRNPSSGSLTRSRSLNVRTHSLSREDGSPTRNGSASATTRTPSMRLGWNRRPGEPRPPPLVSEEVGRRMSRWVKEVVVCNFDLERGPVVERRAGGRRWGQGEKENVAFSSFPDTSLFAEGSIQFSFKIRHIPPEPSSLAHPEPPSPMPDRESQSIEQGLQITSLSASTSASSDDTGSGGGGGGVGGGGLAASGSLKDMSNKEKTEEYRRWDERGREWLYGYVWFEQRRDKGIQRGYMQKSLVILTHLPFPSLFAAVLSRIAPAFFTHGYPALETACHSIASWPDPAPDTVLELPLMTDLLTVKLPDDAETPQVGQAFGLPSPERPILASLPPSTPLRAFATFLPSLWSLWECLILAEPLLIIAPDPRISSQVVWWLRDLLRPIPPAGDFRPYLHIHDHDFSLLVNPNKPQAGVVVGVTNPFFRNAAAHWPNVISMPSDRPRRVAPSGVGPSPSARPDGPEGFLSRRHRSVQKDRALLKRLEALAAEGKLDDPAANEAIRTHFQQLTERFLVPLNRYFQTLLPSLSSPSPSSSLSSTSSSFPEPPTLKTIKPFSLPAFLAHLRSTGPNPLAFRTKGLSTKARVESDFYSSFCMSASFAGWLGARVERMGIAVASQAANNTLSVPSASAPPLGLGIIAPPRVRKALDGEYGETAGSGRGGGGGGMTSESERSDKRFSSDAESREENHGGAGRPWRASEESPREDETEMDRRESYFGGRGGMRRKSEGLVKGLTAEGLTPRTKM